MTLLVPIDVARIMLEDARHDECLSNRPVINERIALGAGPEGLGVGCLYCYPASVTAHTYRDGLPCCSQCAVLSTKSRAPRFVLKHARAA